MNTHHHITFALLIAILVAVIITAIIPFAFETPSKGSVTDHYFEDVASPGITGTDARTAADPSITDSVVEYLPTNPELVQNSDNWHYYQYIYNTGVTWTEEKSLEETSRYGIAGNMTTITSAIENDFVTDLIPENS